MVRNQKRSKRKPSGGRYKQQKVRRQHQTGSEPALTRIAARRTQNTRTMGGNTKVKALSENSISVTDPKSGKVKQATINTVADSPANRHFIRRNILTKGAVVETSEGKARVTNRPGQTGNVQGVLIA